MANKKAEILTMDGQVVSPITLATNVLLDDGRTAQDLLDSRDESMFSPTITTSSSISKVGQGDNVDFSENVIDGAYKSCVLKGKTLVNYNAEGNDRNEYVCMPSVEGSNLTVNDTVEGKVKSAILKGRTVSNLWKELSNVVVVQEKQEGTTIQYDYSEQYAKVTFGEKQANAATTVGMNTTQQLQGNKTYYINTFVLDGNETTDTFLIRDGFNNVNLQTTVIKGYPAGQILSFTTKAPTSRLLFYYFAYTRKYGGVNYGKPFYMPKRFIISDKLEDVVNQEFFEGMQSVRMPVLTTSNEDGTKTNILSCNEEVTLRGIGEVKDTLDGDTGELTQRIGEIALDGSQTLNKYTDVDGFNTYGFYTPIPNVFHSNITTINGLLCDSISVSTFDKIQPNMSGVVDKEGICVNGGYIKFRIDGNKASTVEELKTYLSENPIKLTIPLNQNIIKTVDLSDNVVYSYKDTTHYTCSSEEGSLLPTLTIEEGVKYEAIIKPSTKYSVVFNRTEVTDGLTVDLGGTTSEVITTATGKNIVQITTPPTLSHNYVIFKGLGNVIKDVQVIEGDVVGDEPYFEGMVDVKNPSVMNCNTLDTEDENYKSNTVTTNEVVLRSLPNGVSDTLDLETGEYVQRIGEIGLDGSDDESWAIYVSNREKTVQFRFDMKSTAKGQSDYTKIISSHLPSVDIINNNDIEGVSIYSNGNIYISLLRTKAETLSGLKSHLQSNPITVQYELATPVITTIDLKQHPFAYKDGYIVLTSSSEEVSLTPTIEYSLIANRLGQIQSNQKLIEKQQAQIDELESMVIANLVNTQYQQALNEIKLGVK